MFRVFCLSSCSLMLVTKYIALTSPDNLYHTYMMFPLHTRTETVTYNSWIGGTVFNIRRLSRLWNAKSSSYLLGWWCLLFWNTAAGKLLFIWSTLLTRASAELKRRNWPQFKEREGFWIKSLNQKVLQESEERLQIACHIGFASIG